METKIVCPTVLCSTSILVFSVVAIIYAIMMIYIPANLEMKANVTGPLKCTTIKMDFNVSHGDCHWSSCIEWCLNKPPKLCHQVRVDVRRPGIDLELHHCQLEEIETCKNADDLEPISYRANECDTNCYDKLKQQELTTNGNILMCNNGICRDYSAEYNCSNIQTYLKDLQQDSQCRCMDFTGTFHQKVEFFFLNGQECPLLDHQLYVSCEQLCEYHQQCFNMSRLVRRGYIGNSYIVRNKVYKVYGPIFSQSLPAYRFYQCYDEFCAEIHHMDCNRSCHGALFKTGQERTILFNKETISVVKCRDSGYENTIMACTEIDYPNSTTVIGKDCINGKRLENEPTKQLDMMSLRRILNESQQLVANIPQYEELLLYPNVTLLVNLDGCVNLGNCTDFFDRVKKDGRDQSARYVVPCYYDSFTNSAVIHHDFQAGSVMYNLLLLGGIVPPALLLLSCLVLYITHQMVEVNGKGVLARKKYLCKSCKPKDPWNIFN